jgi:hypothetical protein
MSFVLGYVVNEGGILYINDVPHSSGRGVGRLSRMDQKKPSKRLAD